MPTGYIRVLLGVLAAPPLTQLPANAPEKAAEDGLRLWATVFTWETQVEFLTCPG